VPGCARTRAYANWSSPNAQKPVPVVTAAAVRSVHTKTPGRSIYTTETKTTHPNMLCYCAFAIMVSIGIVNSQQQGYQQPFTPFQNNNNQQYIPQYPTTQTNGANQYGRNALFRLTHPAHPDMFRVCRSIWQQCTIRWSAEQPVPDDSNKRRQPIR
jgi:hypothetical protein